MASNKKIDRALNGPGMIEITLGVLLSVTLGVLLAALHLVFMPVEVVKKAVDEPEADKVYFVEGSQSGSKSGQWKRKRQMMADGGPVEVSFNEDELNAWMSSVAPQGQQADAAAAGFFTPDKVNFRVQESVLQIGLTGKMAAAGITHDLVFQTRGQFEKGPEGFTFVPAELYVGSLPVHAVPGLAPFFIKRILAAQELPEDIQATWKQLDMVVVENAVLRLNLP
jgi:hypothetical protein